MESVGSSPGIRPVHLALWQLSGADPQIVAGCPANEQARFTFIGFLHALIASAFGVLTGSIVYGLCVVVLSESLSANPTNWQRGVAAVVASFSGVFALIIALLMLVSSFRHTFLVTRKPATRLAAACRPFAGAAPSIILALAFTWELMSVGQLHSLATLPLSVSSLLIAVPLVTVLSPLAMGVIWTSALYDRLLAEASAAAGNRSTSATSAAADETTAPTQVDPSRSAEDLRAEADLATAFEQFPGNVSIGRALISVRRRLGLNQQALSVYDALVSGDPNNIGLIRDKAELHRELGDDTRYRKTLEQADRLLEQSSFERNVGQQFFVRNLEIKNLDLFADFRWELQPHVNILLGRNGYGKTQLLRVLVAMLQNDLDHTAPFFRNSGKEARVSLTVDKQGEVLTYNRSVLLFDQTFGKMPVLAIPDMRYIDRSTTSLGAPREVTDLRAEGAAHFLREESYEGLITTFLYGLCLDYIESGKSFELPIFRITESCLQSLSAGAFKFKDIRRKDSARFDILTTTEGTGDAPLPLQKASQGTLSVIAMVGLIYRFLELVYSNVSIEEVANQRATVVIDEIDAHLHPSWQQQILPLFRKTFPGVQFIVTAHSPLVVAGALEREVAVLHKEGTKFKVDVLPEHFIGATSSQMYARVFDIEETDRTYKYFEALEPQKEALEMALQESLEKGDTALTPQQKRQISEQKSTLYYVRQFETVRQQRESAASAVDQQQELEMKVLGLQGRVQELTRQLEHSKANSDPTVSATATQALCQRLLQLHPDAAGPIAGFAAELANLGRNGEAAEVFEALANADPSKPEYWRALALEREKLTEFDAAREALARALRLRPDDQDLNAAFSRFTNRSRAERRG